MEVEVDIHHFHRHWGEFLSVYTTNRNQKKECSSLSRYSEILSEIKLLNMIFLEELIRCYNGNKLSLELY